MRPRASTRVFEGSSSSSTTTIGARVTPPMERACASSGKASFEIGFVKRKSARNTSGAGESTRRNVRTGSAPAYRPATPPPIAIDRRIKTRSEASKAFFSAWAAMSATSAARKTRWTPRRAPAAARPTSSSTASSRSGGTTTSSTAKLITSKPEEPRAAKNSGLSLSRSKSGWATANVHRTASSRKDQSGLSRPSVRSGRSSAARAALIPAWVARSRGRACRTRGARSARRRRRRSGCARRNRARSRGAGPRAWARAAS